MSSIEKQCLLYFNNAIQSEKQDELAPVCIADLTGYLASAHVSIRRHIKSIYNGDIAEFLRRFPEAFQLDKNNQVHLTSDIIRIHGVEALEDMSVEFFRNKLKSLNAFHHSAVSLMALRKSIGDAPVGVQSFINKNYPGKDLKRFLLTHPDVFGISNSGNVYLQGEAPKLPLETCGFQDYWSADAGAIDVDLSKDEADAVHFFRRVLNSPGIELQSCSVDSLFAQVCEAPDNVQRFLRSNYTELNFLDFFRAHKSAFAISSDSPPMMPDGIDQPQSDNEDFSTLQLPKNDYTDTQVEAAWEPPSHVQGGSTNAVAAALKFFSEVIGTRNQQGSPVHVSQLRERLADAPLIVFSYFSSEYPYDKFEKFFLDHADQFCIDSAGNIELPASARNQAPVVSNGEVHSSPSMPEGNGEENAGTWHPRNIQLEKQLERFFLDLFHLASTYGVRVVKPETALEISQCLNRRLTGYLSEHYGKNVAQFFQHYQNRFRVSKNGNICLAVEKDSSGDTMAKKQSSVVAVDFYIALLQLLEAHQVKAISPESLWSFIPLTPPKVQGALSKTYTKDTFKSFFLKSPNKFAMSKSKNVYLSAGAGSAKRDSSDADEYDFESASENTHEASALEFFVDLMKVLHVNACPVPINMLQENLLKASTYVKDYFEETYPQGKFIKFFLKYDNFFYVLQPINVVWLTKLDGADLKEVDAEPCPLDNMPSAFRLLVGVVAAALLVKSPKPFSTILGHLNVVKDQYSQELSKQPGKSKTEKLCSLVSNCFDMFKIVKDNAILSWPLKYASSLLSVLEDALAEVCVKLSTEDIAEVSTFHAALRRNTERLFQCLVPDVKAMVDFLHRRDEFFVVDTDRFIVLGKLLMPDDVDEIAQMVEKELLKSAQGRLPLVSLLATVRDEGFQNHFTSSTVVQAVLTCKDRFDIVDGVLLLRKRQAPGPCFDTSEPEIPVSGDKVEQPTKCTSVCGMGWIISLDGESGLLAATFGSSEDYNEVTFRKDALSATSTNYNDLIVGQEVEFIAVKDSGESEWAIVELRSAGSTPCIDNDKDGCELAEPLGPCECAAHPLDGSDVPSDNTSTNGDDCIFYSSASDSELGLPARPGVNGHYVEGLLRPTNLPAQVQGEAHEVIGHTEGTLPEGGIQEGFADLGMTGEDLLNDDGEWETPYDRRMMDVPFYALPAFKSLNPTPQTAPCEQESSRKPAVMAENLSVPHNTPTAAEVQLTAARESYAEPVLVQGTAAGHEGLKGNLSTWTGTGIWDIEPVPEAAGGDHVKQLTSPVVPLVPGPGDEPPAAEAAMLPPPVPDGSPSYSASRSPSASSKTSSFVYSQRSYEYGPPPGHHLLLHEVEEGGMEGDCEDGSVSPADECDYEQDIYGDEEVDLDTDDDLSEGWMGLQEYEGLGGLAGNGDGPLPLDPFSRCGNLTATFGRTYWEHDKVLPFANVWETPEKVYSVPATVIFLAPAVAVLKSSIQGTPVRLIADPETNSSLDWSELHVGKMVAARAVGSIDDATHLLVVGLRPLRRQSEQRQSEQRQNEQRAKRVDVAAQTISTGSVLSASFLVE